MARNETEAWLALMETADRAQWNGAQEAAIAALVDEVDTFPPVPPIRRPHLAPVDGALGRDDIRPGMRCVNGQWLYSSRWL